MYVRKHAHKPKCPWESMLQAARTPIIELEIDDTNIPYTGWQADAPSAGTIFKDRRFHSKRVQPLASRGGAEV